MTGLLECFVKHECDKGDRHHYEVVYEPLMEPLRELPIVLLEVGVDTGASLAAWADYFPKARILGVDTFVRLSRWRVPIMAHPRVTGYKCNSTRGTPPEVAPGSVDIIIDDGCHAPRAQLATFKGFFPLLKSGGMYFIEDVIINHLGYDELMAGLRAHGAKHHDLRSGNNPGSYLIEIRHG